MLNVFLVKQFAGAFIVFALMALFELILFFLYEFGLSDYSLYYASLLLFLVGAIGYHVLPGPFWSRIPSVIIVVLIYGYVRLLMSDDPQSHLGIPMMVLGLIPVFLGTLICFVLKLANRV